jgi:hypothetical protein
MAGAAQQTITNQLLTVHLFDQVSCRFYDIFESNLNFIVELGCPISILSLLSVGRSVGRSVAVGRFVCLFVFIQYQ